MKRVSAKPTTAPTAAAGSWRQTRSPDVCESVTVRRRGCFMWVAAPAARENEGCEEQRSDNEEGCAAGHDQHGRGPAPVGTSRL